MKKLILAVAILAVLGFTAMYGLNLWVDSLPDVEEPATQAQEVKPKNKYDVGPPTAEELLELVNIEREKAGVAPLTIDDTLTKSAQWKANDMAKNNYFSHDSKDGKQDNNGLDYLDSLQPDCKNIGENIRWTPLDTSTSAEVMLGWQQSPPHIKAIRNREHSTTGFGITKDIDMQRYVIVQHFCVAK